MHSIPIQHWQIFILRCQTMVKQTTASRIKNLLAIELLRSFFSLWNPSLCPCPPPPNTTVTTTDNVVNVSNTVDGKKEPIQAHVHVPLVLLKGPANALLDWLMEAFPDTGHLTPEQRYYNNKASVVVEHVHGIRRSLGQCYLPRSVVTTPLKLHR